MLDMQNVMHIAPNAGHTAQNDSRTMQNDGRTTRNWGAPLGPRGPLLPLYLKRLLIEMI